MSKPKGQVDGPNYSIRLGLPGVLKIKGCSHISRDTTYRQTKAMRLIQSRGEHDVGEMKPEA
jgi:hypothetical protein